MQFCRGDRISMDVKRKEKKKISKVLSKGSKSIKVIHIL